MGITFGSEKNQYQSIINYQTLNITIMKNKAINIEEKGMNLEDGKSMIFRIIDNQIQNQKLKFQAEWERDHNTSPEHKEKAIENLQAIKKQLKDLFAGKYEDDHEINFSLNLEVNVTSKTKLSKKELVMNF